MSEYLQVKKVRKTIRLPLKGSIDFTYRCNNNCRHCWVRIPRDSLDQQQELTTDEIIGIVDEARSMGCREWFISGGEPMLRPDFAEIFDYISLRAVSYSLNTNGTLITPKIARLLKGPGSKMVALYGATADVHDHITRIPGSFEAVMQGFAHLKEAGAGFTVQLIPMRDNYHQFKEMERLAQSLSSSYRIGAPWLFLSADGNPEKNREILRQRLDPAEVIALNGPDLSDGERKETRRAAGCRQGKESRLFASCVANGQRFHIDPYGQMALCLYIKDPSLRYDLKNGSFENGWEHFLPAIANRVDGGREFMENCGTCDLRPDCRWCPVYGYLEHQRYSAKVAYLCSVARENRRRRDNWNEKHRRFYEIAGVTIQVEADLPIKDSTFHSKFNHFQVDGPGADNVVIRHHFYLPDLNRWDWDGGKELYRKPPWAIFRNHQSWLYLGYSSPPAEKNYHTVAVINNGHTRARIYTQNIDEKIYSDGNLEALTLFPSDQILLARLFADREGCYFHSSGVIHEGRGLLFMGHSDAGKSTIVKMFKGKAEILCDDRIVVRRRPEGFKIYGTWSPGEVPDVSSGSAPLRAIFFLEKGSENRVVSMNDKRMAIGKLLGCLIKPLETVDWWEKMLSLVTSIAHEVPCDSLIFNQNGSVVDLLQHHLENNN